jgi:hypothetical protein
MSPHKSTTKPVADIAPGLVTFVTSATDLVKETVYIVTPHVIEENLQFAMLGDQESGLSNTHSTVNCSQV